MRERQINVASDFSPFPAGRFREDGPASGEAFRVDILVPALRHHEVVCVHLDEAEGYGSSFLDEAFGGLVRNEGFLAGDLRKKLFIVTEDFGWEKEIWHYIDSAASANQ